MNAQNVRNKLHDSGYDCIPSDVLNEFIEYLKEDEESLSYLSNDTDNPKKKSNPHKHSLQKMKSKSQNDSEMEMVKWAERLENLRQKKKKINKYFDACESIGQTSSDNTMYFYNYKN